MATNHALAVCLDPSLPLWETGPLSPEQLETERYWRIRLRAMTDRGMPDRDRLNVQTMSGLDVTIVRRVPGLAGLLARALVECPIADAKPVSTLVGHCWETEAMRGCRDWLLANTKGAARRSHLWQGVLGWERDERDPADLEALVRWLPRERSPIVRALMVTLSGQWGARHHTAAYRAALADRVTRDRSTRVRLLALDVLATERMMGRSLPEDLTSPGLVHALGTLATEHGESWAEAVHILATLQGPLAYAETRRLVAPWTGAPLGTDMDPVVTEFANRGSAGVRLRALGDVARRAEHAGALLPFMRAASRSRSEATIRPVALEILTGMVPVLPESTARTVLEEAVLGITALPDFTRMTGAATLASAIQTDWYDRLPAYEAWAMASARANPHVAQGLAGRLDGRRLEGLLRHYALRPDPSSSTMMTLLEAWSGTGAPLSGETAAVLTQSPHPEVRLRALTLMSRIHSLDAA